ncbi:MAG: hypothetical protein ABIU29_07680 [Chthoniobacterales bacterium]
MKFNPHPLRIFMKSKSLVLPSALLILAALGSSSTAQAQTSDFAPNPYRNFDAFAPEAAADVVTILKARYITAREVLTVQATSTSTTAALQLFVTSTDEFIGILTEVSPGKYVGRFSFPLNPESVTIRSTDGGTDTAVVEVR